MRYFVTGATGFVGGALTHELLKQGHDVVALVRSPKKASSIQAAGAKIAQGDITDRESMRIPMSGVDGVFHVAGWYKVGVRDKTPGEKTNVAGTRNVLELMRELGIRKGVYTSTLGVFSDSGGEMRDETFRYDGPHLSEYERTKWAAHFQVAEPMMNEGLPLVIVLPGAIYGPEDTSAMGEAFRQYLQGKFPAVPKGLTFCWAHVGDVVRGHILAMEKGKPGESYIIAGPPHAMEEVFEMAERITGIPSPPLRLSPPILKILSGIMGTVEKVVPGPEEYSGVRLRVTAGSTYLGSSEKAKRELGYSVRPLEEGLRETLLYEMT
ncbi:MAG: NAD-dependent epimerase/dehydratase family protein [Thermodesulfobacteriota bacterium]